MGSNNFFKPGEWNFYCSLCGKKHKSTDGRKTWDGHWVCKEHKEERNPQDFLRGARESLSVPWTKPAGPDIFVELDYTRQLDDQVGVAEGVAKATQRLIGVVQHGDSSLNGFALGGLGLNATIQPVANSERIVFTETLVFAGAHDITEAETLPITEGFTFHFTSLTALNGSSLNNQRLG